MKIISLILFLSFQAQAASLEFENSWNFFTQKLGPGFTLPEPLSNRAKLVIQLELPDSGGSTLKKVYSQAMDVNEFRAIIEIYYFDQNSQKYLSQQLYFYKEGDLVARCASYFGLEQKFLVPGSCAGVSGKSLFGIAIYK